MKQRGNTLIATLFTVAIMMILAVVFLKGGGFGTPTVSETSPRADGEGKTIPGLVKAKAQDEVCRNNLSQIRQAIMMAKQTEEDAMPQSLAELKAIPANMNVCPIGSEAYSYDPSTGTVYCPHPGHEKY